MLTMLDRFKAARRVSTPLICIETPDYKATMEAIAKAVNGKENPPPLIKWDIIQGMLPLNGAGEQALTDIEIDDDNRVSRTGNPAECLQEAKKLGPEAILFWLNAHRYLEPSKPGSDPVAQAIWNLRDPYKNPRRTLVMLCPEVKLPSELAQDVLVLDEPLPTEAELGEIAQKLYESAAKQNKGMPEIKDYSPIVSATLGLAAFPADQAIAMSITKSGIDVAELWERKRKTIEQTPGLKFETGTETFDDIGGLDQAKKFILSLMRGRKAPSLICRIEEIEKSMAGAGAATGGVGDTSGTSQDALGVILTAMEDFGWSGMIAAGPPGSGKSMISKAAGNTCGVKTLVFDMGACKGSYVGESEQKIRSAVKIMHALGGDRVFFIASCNRLETLPPELKRRYKYGVWVFDLPDKRERETQWKLHTKRYEISEQTLPDEEGLSGADIRNICEIAWRLNITLKEATQFIVPAAKMDPDAIQRIRKLAAGKFLSASYPGPYRMPSQRAQESDRSIEVA